MFTYGWHGMTMRKEGKKDGRKEGKVGRKGGKEYRL
jgi:hypothetical protein